jgi:hypothetical protein
MSDDDRTTTNVLAGPVIGCLSAIGLVFCVFLTLFIGLSLGRLLTGW